MHRTQRVLFSFQFGASLTFGCFPQGPKKIARRIQRRATSRLRSAPRVLYARPVGRVHKRPRRPRRQAELSPHKPSKKERLKRILPAQVSKRLKRAKPAKVEKAARTSPALLAGAGRRPWFAGCGRLLVLCLDKLFTTLFISVNLFLAGYAGAGLATTARLKYDPSTYLVLREIFPEDLAYAVRTLPQASQAALALAHLAVVAVVMPRAPRCLLLMLYAACTAWALWEELRVWRDVWPGMERRLAAGRDQLLYVIYHMHIVLGIISQWHGYAWKLQTILWEFERESPMNVIVAKRAAKVFAALQVAGGALAVLAALTGLCRPVRERRYY